MKFYITTDTHFGHRNMEIYCKRPHDFEDRISKYLFANCKSEDVLIHLGDICMGKDEFWHNSFIIPLPCKKWLIRGNHDKKSNNWYLSHGWDFVGDEFLLKFEGKNILFSHEPVQKRDGVDINIHGHIHNHLERLLNNEFVVEGEKERNSNWLDSYDKKYHKLISLEEIDYKSIDLSNLI